MRRSFLYFSTCMVAGLANAAPASAGVLHCAYRPKTTAPLQSVEYPWGYRYGGFTQYKLETNDANRLTVTITHASKTTLNGTFELTRLPEVAPYMRRISATYGATLPDGQMLWVWDLENAVLRAPDDQLFGKRPEIRIETSFDNRDDSRTPGGPRREVGYSPDTETDLVCVNRVEDFPNVEARPPITYKFDSRPGTPTFEFLSESLRRVSTVIDPETQKIAPVPQKFWTDHRSILTVACGKILVRKGQPAIGDFTDIYGRPTPGRPGTPDTYDTACTFSDSAAEFYRQPTDENFTLSRLIGAEAERFKRIFGNGNALSNVGVSEIKSYAPPGTRSDAYPLEVVSDENSVELRVKMLPLQIPGKN